ncbi:hypothetical protein GWZ58_06870 [Vibrio cholerae]|uniref:hypothetical protein n=1 Tax=Vibrio cholerae TaxID=666 RepID=UPI0015618A77|nr:hypothetical protein [Vibrio cholerae]EKF9413618.1 hypothetical protein [Vibrio cholerae]NOF59319.1 hypothetical protein [Vibrio cholerae]NOF69407.1 hypothetical protein [Vibrio cholerae]NOF83051.1 hypothetical protein [Vibrio cholerae]
MNEMLIIIKSKDILRLINTSVSDAEISLKNILAKNPQRAEAMAIMMLDKLEKMDEQKSRKAMVERVIRQAKKAIKSK